MLHELGHLMLRGSGVCDLDIRPGRPPQEQKTEVFCNHVAGAALVPQEHLLAHPVVRQHPSQRWNPSDIELLSSEFSVSREVILRRLLTFQLTTVSFYQQARRELQREYERRPKGKGGPSPSVNVVSAAGKPFARIVLEAFYADRLTSSEVSDYLGVRLKHLKKIGQAVGLEWSA